MRVMPKFFVLLILSTLMTNIAYSHCQIPCGIYGDDIRINLLREHISTIEKGMNQINDLSKKASSNMNQLVRWVNNKDKHADEFTDIVTYYFLSQRIKIADPKESKNYTLYQTKVSLLHQMMVFSMKCKQTTDLKNVEMLKTLLSEFVDIYYTPEQIKHLKEHN